MKPDRPIDPIGIRCDPAIARCLQTGIDLEIALPAMRDRHQKAAADVVGFAADGEIGEAADPAAVGIVGDGGIPNPPEHAARRELRR